jgi:hypothetical protein
VGTAFQRSGEESLRTTASVATNEDLYIEGSPNPPPALGVGPHRTPALLLGPHHVFTPSHWNCPSTTDSSLLISSSATVVPSKKSRSGRRECLPRDGEGGKVLKRNTTHLLIVTTNAYKVAFTEKVEIKVFYPIGKIYRFSFKIVIYMPFTLKNRAEFLIFFNCCAKQVHEPKAFFNML